MNNQTLLFIYTKTLQEEKKKKNDAYLLTKRHQHASAPVFTTRRILQDPTKLGFFEEVHFALNA